MKLLLRFVIVVCSSLILAEFSVGFFGVWANWLLMSIIAVAAFALGWWGFEER